MVILGWSEKHSLRELTLANKPMAALLHKSIRQVASEVVVRDQLGLNFQNVIV
jgi:hypothetical protein